jgi:replicative DNA helicase
MILTASEGGGKSTLLRQLAVTIAAGIHPFRHDQHITPATVLVLDCENGAPASRRKYRPLVNAAARTGRPLRRGAFHIECRPEGIDLTRPADRAWVMRRVELLKPELLIIGPVYRLHAGNPNDEELARKVSVVIDEARATTNCAVLMEAHAPHHNGFTQHRNLRPLGSSLWMRWPEFGFGLRPVEDEKSAANTEGARGRRFVPWRGMRDERDWPQFLRAGDDWPWITYKPQDLDEFTGHSPTGAIW